MSEIGVGFLLGGGMPSGGNIVELTNRAEESVKKQPSYFPIEEDGKTIIKYLVFIGRGDYPRERQHMGIRGFKWWDTVELQDETKSMADLIDDAFIEAEKLRNKKYPENPRRTVIIEQLFYADGSNSVDTIYCWHYDFWTETHREVPRYDHGLQHTIDKV